MEPSQVPEEYARRGRVGVEGIVRRVVTKLIVEVGCEGHEPSVKVEPDE